MRNITFFNGFEDEESYKIYRLTARDLEFNIIHIREEEERKQITYWLKSDYKAINRKVIKMLGYIECLFDFDKIGEETFEALYDSYSIIRRETEERIDELSEE